MKKSTYLILGWILTLLISIIWTYENPEKIKSVKNKLKLYVPKNDFKKPVDDKVKNIFDSNHFKLKFEKIVSLDGKTSFVVNNSINKEFNINDVSIYTQEGFKLKKDNSEKLNINKNFTEDYNGGLKTVFFVNNKVYGLTSSLRKNCYYAAIVDLSSGIELFRSACLPENDNPKLDFNGLGSSTIHLDNKVLISIGTPTYSSNTISNLAQNKNSYFGKILSIEMDNFKKNKLKPKNFSIGHRNPQGITKINDLIFSLEHGPQGGDELNKIKFGFNYGWPKVSYGTKYPHDDKGKSYSIGHDENGFEEPLFAFVPSIGVSALNICPSKLLNYYKKNCLVGLSLYGNDLRPGKSLLIFLLDKNFEKIHSIEKILLEKPLRHFMTNNKNEIFEDSNGDIYLSSDNNGIYRVSFNNFR